MVLSICLRKYAIHAQASKRKCYNIHIIRTPNRHPTKNTPITISTVIFTTFIPPNLCNDMIFLLIWTYFIVCCIFSCNFLGF